MNELIRRVYGWLTGNGSSDEDKGIRFVGDMQRLQPMPGDVFVVTSDNMLTQEAAFTIKAALTTALEGHKVIVIGDGLRLGCVAMPGKYESER